MAQALKFAEEDQAVVRFIRDHYWSRASKKQSTRLHFQEKAMQAKAEFTPEQWEMASKALAILNRR